MKVARAWRAYKGILIPTLLLVNTAVIVTALVLAPRKQTPWRFISGLVVKPSAAEGAVPPAAPIVRVEDVLVKLRAADDQDRYLGAAFDLEIATEKDKETVTRQMPRIRDAMLAFLSDRSPEDLQGSDRLQIMKQKLLERLDTLLPGRRLKAIYITNLVMQ